MNEREDYLDRLLRGVEDGPEEGIQETDDGFSDEDDDFLQAFEKSMSQSEEDELEDLDMGADLDMDSGLDSDLDMDSDMSLDFDMEDIDNIVSNIKNGTLDDEKDTPMDESSKDFTEGDMGLDSIGAEFDGDSDDQDYMVNTLDGDGMEFGDGEENKGLQDMLSGIGDDIDTDFSSADKDAPARSTEADDDISEDELDSMAKELAMEIDDLSLDGIDDGPDIMADELNLENLEETSNGKGKKRKKEKKKKSKDSDGEKKPGFFKRISLALFGNDDDSGTEIPEAGEMENISDENMEILKELEGQKNTAAEDEKAKKAQKKKEAKEKKEKKKKEKAEQKAQKAKEKQAKPKKEKKPKPPKPVVKTKPLPKLPVFMILLVAASLVVLINLMSTQIGYMTGISEAEDYYGEGSYVEAFACFPDKEEDIKEVDLELYNKVRLTAYLQQPINKYNIYQEQELYADALSSLICGVGRYDKNARDAAQAGAAVEYEKMLAVIEEALKTNYGMTLDEARAVYDNREQDDYTYAVLDIIEKLGLGEEK